MLSAILYGLRISLGVGVISTLIALTLGMAIGLAAGYAGGWIDALIMRIVDLQLSFPSILIALVLLAVLGQGVDKIVIALVTVQWAYYARTVRGTALVEKRKEYVDAARVPRLSAVRASSSATSCRTACRRSSSSRRCRSRTRSRSKRRCRSSGSGMPITSPSLGLLIANGYAHLLSRAVLDQLLPRRRAARDDRRDQPRRRPPARRAQSAASEPLRCLSPKGVISDE